MRLRSVAIAALALGGAAAFLRRTRPEPERVDLYFDDGSLISLESGSPEGDSLLALAADVLRS